MTDINHDKSAVYKGLDWVEMKSNAAACTSHYPSSRTMKSKHPAVEHIQDVNCELLNVETRAC
jgi:hypothetical protein